MQLTAFMRGYLALVGALEQGRGISQGADFLQPTVDVGTLLGLAQRKFYQNSWNHNASFVAGGTPATVPPGKVWRVLNSTMVFVTDGTGVARSPYLGVRLPDDLAIVTPTMLAKPTSDDLVINDQVVCAFNGELWLPSGAIFGSYGANLNPVISVTWSAMVEEFPG